MGGSIKEHGVRPEGEQSEQSHGLMWNEARRYWVHAICTSQDLRSVFEEDSSDGEPGSEPAVSVRSHVLHRGDGFRLTLRARLRAPRMGLHEGNRRLDCASETTG